MSYEVSTRIPLSPDGIASIDAKFYDTANEVVECGPCKRRGPLKLAEEEEEDDLEQRQEEREPR